jgi:hypothetical protein
MIDVLDCILCMGTSLIEPIGTEAGAVMCHISFPTKFAGENSSAALEDGWTVIEEASNPNGGS